MDAAELVELLSPEGLRLLDSLPRYESTDDVVRSVAELRKAGHPPALVAAVLSQARLRARAEAKFGPFAKSMLFTEPGLEQATRLQVAARHAGRYQAAGLSWIADLGCGIGADALAIAALDIEVTAVDRDEVTAAVAAYNLAAWSNARVEHADVTEFDLSGVDGVYLDPARRSAGRSGASKRLSNPADWSPSLDFAFGLARRLPIGVKLGPGIDRSLIPEDAEAQWVSVGHDVVEVGVWTGVLARPGIRRSALVLGDGTASELTGAEDAEDAEVGELGEFLYEPDGAVIRARLIGDLVRAMGGRMLDPTIAYFTTDQALETAFATRFRFVERFPLDERLLKRELAARKIGTIEIKKRGVDVDPAAFRKKLAPKGPNAATLVLTRVAGKRVALLVERAVEL